MNTEFHAPMLVITRANIIITGIFGVPLDVCARAMYLAIRDFSAHMSITSMLRRIHIVNNNTDATDLIHAIFEQLMDAQNLSSRRIVEPKDSSSATLRGLTNKNRRDTPSPDTMSSSDSYFTTASARTGANKDERRKEGTAELACIRAVATDRGYADRDIRANVVQSCDRVVTRDHYSLTDHDGKTQHKTRVEPIDQTLQLCSRGNQFSRNYEFRPIERQNSDDQISYESESDFN